MSRLVFVTRFMWFLLCFSIILCMKSLESSFGEKYDSFGRIGRAQGLVRENSLVPITVNAAFNHKYNYTLDKKNNTYIFVYSYKENLNESVAVRINVTCMPPDQEFPVLFVVKQQRGILSWQLPLILEDSYEYPAVSRTLCPIENQVKKRMKREAADFTNQTFNVDISSMSLLPTHCTLHATLVSNFIVRTMEQRTVTAAPYSPVYYQYIFPDDIDSVVVKFQSVGDTRDTCAIVSIQKTSCPVFDLENNVEFGKIQQTMTRKAALNVLKTDFQDNIFYIVFVVKATDLECSGIEKLRPTNESGADFRAKTFKFTVEYTLSAKMYWQAALVPVAVLLAFYLITGIVVLILYMRNRHKERSNEIEEHVSESDEHLVAPITARDMQTYGSTSNSAAPNFTRDSNGIPHRVRADTLDSDISSIDEADIDRLSDTEEYKDVYRTKTYLYVMDLSRKNRRVLASKYKLYHRNLITIAIFYGLPVVQLVLTYQKVLNLTGNEDICYYNFFCSRPLGVLSQFNNVFSNIGYVMLGILFLLITYRRDYLSKAEMKKDPEKEKTYGIPQHFGLYYAMGLALAMEGVMSGCYHVCPSYSNFQFDTSFMYIIAGLCMLKIYQIRHPDINATAHSAYFFLAWIILFGVIGVIYGHGSLVFWIIIAVLHICVCLSLSTQIYYVGRWQMDIGMFKRIYTLIKTECCSRPMYMDRLILLIIANAANWSLAFYGAVTQPRDVSSFFLAIFIMNLLLYTCIYIIMKLRNKERIKLLPCFFILSSIIVWGFALYFFMQHLTTWQLSPAESREGNKECLLLDFYDDHDVWHLLSATALFLSFMVLLTLDDDLENTRRDKIPVF